MIYCTLCNPAIDVLYEGSDFQSGTTFTDVKSTVLPAGKGLNVAKSVVELGEEAFLLGLMPSLDESRFKQSLENKNIKYDFYLVDGSARVNTTIMESSSMQTTHINSIGADYNTRIQDEYTAFLESHIQSDDIWALSGSLPSGFDSDSYFKVIKTLNEKNNKAVLDTRDEALNMGVRAKPFMVTPNLSELEAFFGEHIEGIFHIALKAKRLIDMGVEHVFVTLDSDGMIAVHKNECLLCTVPSVDVKDTVGCGDAVVAGLMVAYARDFSFQEMCRLAVACGTSNAMHSGAGSIVRDEVWQIMENIKIEAI